MDNSCEIAQNDPQFAPRYLNEVLQILQKADKGNAELRETALQAIYKELKILRDQA